MKEHRRSGPIAENILRDIGSARRSGRRKEQMSQQPIKFYQTGTFTVGNRLLEDDERSVQSNMRRTNSLNSGHRACRGCGEALGARYAIDAVMQAAGNKAIAVNATGCLEVFSTPVSGDVVADPVDAFAVRQRGGGRGRRGRGDARQGPHRRARDRARRRRRHHRHRVRLPLGNVRAQRRRALHLLRQRSLHEHRRAALVGDPAGGAHRDDAGRRPASRQRVQHRQEPAADRDGAPHPLRGDRLGRQRARPRSEGDARDVRSAARATSTCTCRVRSAGDPSRPIPIKVARMAVESGLFPLFEAEYGEVTGRYDLRRPVPVDRVSASLQKRFAPPLRQERRPASGRRDSGDRRSQHPRFRPAAEAQRSGS